MKKTVIINLFLSLILLVISNCVIITSCIFEESARNEQILGLPKGIESFYRMNLIDFYSSAYRIYLIIFPSIFFVLGFLPFVRQLIFLKICFEKKSLKKYSYSFFFLSSIYLFIYVFLSAYFWNTKFLTNVFSPGELIAFVFIGVLFIYFFYYEFSIGKITKKFRKIYDLNKKFDYNSLFNFSMESDMDYYETGRGKKEQELRALNREIYLNRSNIEKKLQLSKGKEKLIDDLKRMDEDSKEEKIIIEKNKENNSWN